jgi:hypothetical protein
MLRTITVEIIVELTRDGDDACMTIDDALIAHVEREIDTSGVIRQWRFVRITHDH